LTVDGSNVTANVNSDGKYTFTMPSHNVSVNAIFAPINAVTYFNLTSYSSIPENWTCSAVDPGSYFKVGAGGYMISPSYDLSDGDSAIVSIKVAKFGTGTNPAAVLSVSYDGGTTWAESKTLTAPSSSTYLAAQTFSLSKTFTDKVVIKLENPTGNAALRVQNFSFTGTK
jgi:hypothetical protein